MKNMPTEVREFFEGNGVKLTIVDNEPCKDTFVVSLEGDAIGDKRELSKLVRQDKTDRFLLTHIRTENALHTALVVPKKPLEQVACYSRHIANAMEALLEHIVPTLMDEKGEELFDEVVVEMYDLADQADDLLFHSIVPYGETFDLLTEFKEATNHVFGLYRGMIDKKTHYYYTQLIETLDRLEA